MSRSQGRGKAAYIDNHKLISSHLLLEAPQATRVAGLAVLELKTIPLQRLASVAIHISINLKWLTKEILDGPQALGAPGVGGVGGSVCESITDNACIPRVRPHRSICGRRIAPREERGEYRNG